MSSANRARNFTIIRIGARGLEPLKDVIPTDFKSVVSTDSTTLPYAPCWIRTSDSSLRRRLLWSAELTGHAGREDRTRLRRIMSPLLSPDS